MKKVVLTDGLHVLIRPQTLEDAGELWRLYSSLSRQTRLLAGVPEQMSEQEFHERMAENVKNKNRHRFVCIVQSPEEKFIGYFGIDTPEDPETGWIFLFVQDAYQGKGLGKEILKYIIEKASSLGIKTLKCQVDPENTPAIKLYQRFDFKKEKELIDSKTKKLAYTMYRAVSSHQ